MNIHQPRKCIRFSMTHRLLVKVVTDILHNIANALWSIQCLLTINISYFLLIIDLVRLANRTNIVNPKRQHILVSNRINYGVGMQLIAKRLLGSS